MAPNIAIIMDKKQMTCQLLWSKKGLLTCLDSDDLASSSWDSDETPLFAAALGTDFLAVACGTLLTLLLIEKLLGGARRLSSSARYVQIISWNPSLDFSIAFL